MTIQALKRDLASLKEAIKPEAHKALVIFLDEEENIVEIQGQDIASWTPEEISMFLDLVPIHFYFHRLIVSPVPLERL